MRFNRTYQEDGGFREDRPEPVVSASPGAEPAATQMTSMAPTPSADPGPGPNTNPSSQGGRPTPSVPPPPATPSAIPGLTASDATGGIQGSFGQAGSSDFSRKFGLPAAWFRGGPTAGLGLEAANRGRVGIGGDRSALVGGGGGGESVANVAGPSVGLEGGNKNDEEFQRIIQAVMRNRFQ